MQSQIGLAACTKVGYLNVRCLALRLQAAVHTFAGRHDNHALARLTGVKAGTTPLTADAHASFVTVQGVSGCLFTLAAQEVFKRSFVVSLAQAVFACSQVVFSCSFGTVSCSFCEEVALQQII